jgi:hypothetical protein
MTTKKRAASQSAVPSKATRRLSDLVSVGPATIKDFEVLGIYSVDALKGLDSVDLYERLCERTQARHDPCVIDVFRAAIEQANDSELDPKKCDWWYWSRVRKGAIKHGRKK